MASPPVIDFDEVLQPIEGDNPAGSSMPFTLRQDLEQARKEDNPDNYDADDPRRPTDFKSADWPRIVQLCRTALAGTSKDLQLAARMTEALTHLHGFAGLRDGLHLMFLLLDQCWDRLHPPIEEPDDLEVRAAAFTWLDDPDRGALFPLTVRAIPLFANPPVSLFDWKQMQQGKGALTQEDFEKAIQFASFEDCQHVAEDIAAAVAEIAAISAKADQLMGQAAPGLSMVRMALDECRQLIGQVMQRKTPAAPAPVDEKTPSQEVQPAPGEPTTARGRTREDLYRQLNDIAGQLQKIEPHSPIPYLVRKAVELGALPFPMLIKALVRNNEVLSELSRELGLQEQDNAQQAQ